MLGITIGEGYVREGNRISPPIDLSPVRILHDSSITWHETIPNQTNLIVEASLDQENWEECTNGQAIPVLYDNMNTDGKVLYLRQRLSSDDFNETPEISNVEITLEAKEYHFISGKFKQGLQLGSYKIEISLEEGEDYTVNFWRKGADNNSYQQIILMTNEHRIIDAEVKSYDTLTMVGIEQQVDVIEDLPWLEIDEVNKKLIIQPEANEIDELLVMPYLLGEET